MRTKPYILILILFCFKLNAQQVKNVDFIEVNNQIEVTFDLLGKNNQSFNLEVVIEVNHQRYYPQKIYGKTQNVKPSKGIKLTLKPLEEALEIKGDLRVGIQATPIYNLQEYNSYKGAGYYNENIVKSAILPGWGHFNTNGKISNVSGTVISGLYISCLSGVVYNHLNYKKNYVKYQNAINQEDIDFWYNKANSQYRSFQGFIWAGIAIWGLDLWYVNTKAKSDSRKRENTQSSAFSPNFQLLTTSNSVKLGLNLKF